mmetsp:Transcript_2767/g.2406  ORF Transcript_2767/g.2406 Transcript_2767/m.2406 type:complete len:109 (+) Transcript_2767:78-404(+)
MAYSSVDFFKQHLQSLQDSQTTLILLEVFTAHQLLTFKIYPLLGLILICIFLHFFKRIIQKYISKKHLKIAEWASVSFAYLFTLNNWDDKSSFLKCLLAISPFTLHKF